MEHYKIKLYAPEIAPKYRHKTIMKTFDDLSVGEVMEISNNHDPKPLYYQFLIERDGQFIWKYVEDGPDFWRITIEKK